MENNREMHKRLRSEPGVVCFESTCAAHNTTAGILESQWVIPTAQRAISAQHDESIHNSTLDLLSLVTRPLRYSQVSFLILKDCVTLR